MSTVAGAVVVVSVISKILETQAAPPYIHAPVWGSWLTVKCEGAVKVVPSAKVALAVRAVTTQGVPMLELKNMTPLWSSTILPFGKYCRSSVTVVVPAAICCD